MLATMGTRGKEKGKGQREREFTARMGRRMIDSRICTIARKIKIGGKKEEKKDRTRDAKQRWSKTEGAGLREPSRKEGRGN